MRTAHLLPIALVAFSFSACFCAPQKAGDACDAEADADPCPTGLVCEETDDGGRCHVVLGGTCDDEADDAFCADGAACAGREPVCGGAGGGCDLERQNCADALVCDPVSDAADDGDPGVCSAPLSVRGQVIDAESRAPIADADVIALDEIGSAITRVATTDADGRYRLRIPARRTADGAPAPMTITLRAAARDHQTFPGGVRAALPIALEDAEPPDDDDEDPSFIVESSLTTIALVALPAAERGRPTVSGTVAAGEDRAGVLVLVEGGAVPAPGALSDFDGVFRVFNVAPGASTVRGYAAGLQLTPEPIDVTDDDVDGVVLERDDGETATVSGSVQIVNAAGGLSTSVVLVPEASFVEDAARGEVPRGLRAPENGPPTVDGAFSIGGVPRGRYVVLAAFENDELVRDPDPNISGTQIVTLEVTGGGELSIDESFKITEALPVVSPGADGPELVDAPPTFVFGNDSSEDFYRVEVFDSFGVVVWSADVPAPGGSDDVEVPYAGPALDVGAYYQFRATSMRDTGPISRTEDLRGVFLVAE